MMIELYLIHETDRARLYRRGEDDEDETIWIPKSIIQDALKFPAREPGELERHQLELPDWFCNQNDL